MAKIVAEGTKKQPTIYRLRENGDDLMLGSEVGACLGFYKGALYKRFPSLWRKVLNSEERDLMGRLSVGTRTLSNMGTMVVRASEAIEILNGDGDIYRKKDTEVAAENNRNKEAINAAFCRVHSSNIDKSVIKQMTYAADARERNNELMEKLRSEVEDVILAPTPVIIPSVELDSPAVAVMNSVSLDTLSSPTKRKRRYDDMKPKEITVAQLHSSAKVFDALNSNLEEQQKAANGKDELVPIRLDIEANGHKLRDTFTWNKNETLITPEAFAELLCEDLELPSNLFVPSIVQALKGQIEQHSREEEAEKENLGSTDQRVMMKLNLHVGNVSLQDQFEWDMTEPLNSPEEFARSLCTELGLGGEFITAIAYSIRGQLSYYKKTYAYHEDQLPTVKKPFRSFMEIDRFCPEINTLTDAEMEKKLKNQDRSSRRMRRLANIAPYLQ